MVRLEQPQRPNPVFATDHLMTIIGLMKVKTTTTTSVASLVWELIHEAVAMPRLAKEGGGSSLLQIRDHQWVCRKGGDCNPIK